MEKSRIHAANGERGSRYRRPVVSGRPAARLEARRESLRANEKETVACGWTQPSLKDKGSRLDVAILPAGGDLVGGAGQLGEVGKEQPVCRWAAGGPVQVDVCREVLSRSRLG